MKVEFYRLDDEERLAVAEVAWADGRVDVRSDDGELAEALRRAFRRSPVVTGDAAFRRRGTFGDVVIQPGSLEWFRATALERATRETGLGGRIVTDVDGGYDPAANYRPFGEQVERLTTRASHRGTDLRP